MPPADTAQGLRTLKWRRAAADPLAGSCNDSAPLAPGGVPREARALREPLPHRRVGLAGARHPPAWRRLKPPRARSCPARPLAHGRRNPAAAPAPQPAERVGELRSAAGAPNGSAEAALLGLRRARRRLPAGGGRARTADGRAGGRPGVGLQVGRGARRPWGTPFGQLSADAREEASREPERRRPAPGGDFIGLKIAFSPLASRPGPAGAARPPRPQPPPPAAQVRAGGGGCPAAVPCSGLPLSPAGGLRAVGEAFRSAARPRARVYLGLCRCHHGDKFRRSVSTSRCEAVWEGRCHQPRFPKCTQLKPNQVGVALRLQ